MTIPKSFYYVASRILIGVGQLMIIRVLTSILNPVEIGKYYLLMSFVSISSVFLINPVLMYSSRHFFGWYQDGIALPVMKKLITFLSIVSIAVGLIIFGFKKLGLLDGQLLGANVYLFIPLLVIGSTISVYPLELLNIIGKSRAFILLSNFELWGKIGIISLFALMFQPTTTTIIGAITFWSLVFSIFSGTVLYSSLRSIQVKKKLLKFAGVKDIFSFAWPFSIATCFYWCQTDGYRFVLQHVSGVEVVGKFVVGFNLGATLMIALDILFHQLYLPVYYREISVETVESHAAAWNKYAEKVAGVFIPFGLYIACAGPFLSRWLLHSTYWDMGIYAAFGAISQLFRIFSGSLSNGIIARKQTSILIIPNLIGAIMALVGTFLLSKKYPIIGTGISLVISYFIVTIGLYIQLVRKLKIRIPFSNIFNSLKLITPICIILLITFMLGFASIPVLNILTLLVTGFGLFYIQWILSKDIWFHQSYLKVGKTIQV